MSLKTITVPPLDPQTFTGPTRTMAGVARTGNVTPGIPYNEFARWLYVGTSGNISIIKWDGTTQVIFNLLPGVWHPIYSIGVNTVDTTASGIIWGS